MHIRTVLCLAAIFWLTGIQSCSRTLSQVCETDLVQFQKQLQIQAENIGESGETEQTPEQLQKWIEERMGEVQLLLAYLEDLQVNTRRLIPVHDVGNSLVLAWGYASQSRPDSVKRALLRARERAEEFQKNLCH